MVEDPIQQHPKTGPMKRLTDLPEVLPGAQAAIYGEIIPGVVAVAVALPEGIHENGICPDGLDVGNPVQQPEDPMLQNPVLLPGGAA